MTARATDRSAAPRHHAQALAAGSYRSGTGGVPPLRRPATAHRQRLNAKMSDLRLEDHLSEHLEKTFSSTRNRLKDARRDLRSADSPQLAKRADSPERQDFADDRGDRGCRLMVRHGYHHLWKVTTADGAAEVRAPQVHDRRVDETRSPRLR